MLEPREADIPVLFLVLVVLPLVAYFLLGKWSEAAKKRERIDLLAHMATEESFRAEAVPTVAATATAFPFVSPSKNGIHVCARCLSPATTRCSRCKSVRYWYVLFLFVAGIRFRTICLAWKIFPWLRKYPSHTLICRCLSQSFLGLIHLFIYKLVDGIEKLQMVGFFGSNYLNGVEENVILNGI